MSVTDNNIDRASKKNSDEAPRALIRKMKTDK
jgi:hypothetical protein